MKEIRESRRAGPQSDPANGAVQGPQTQQREEQSECDQQYEHTEAKATLSHCEKHGGTEQEHRDRQTDAVSAMLPGQLFSPLSQLKSGRCLKMV